MKSHLGTKMETVPPQNQAKVTITFLALCLGGWRMFFFHLLGQVEISNMFHFHTKWYVCSFTVLPCLPKLVSSQSPQPSPSPEPASLSSCTPNSVAGTGGGGVCSFCCFLLFVALPVKLVPSSKMSGVVQRGWSFIAVLWGSGAAGVLSKSSHASSSSSHPSASLDEDSWLRVGGGATESSKSCAKEIPCSFQLYTGGSMIQMEQIQQEKLRKSINRSACNYNDKHGTTTTQHKSWKSGGLKC